MNFSDPNSGADDLETAIHSLQDWWSLAGVDLDYQLEPAVLLEDISTKSSVKPSEKPNVDSNQILTTPSPAVTEETKFDTFGEDYPTEYEAFQNWIKNPSNLVETTWSKNLVHPDGCLEPQVMIISSMPEVGGVSDGEYYSANERKLLKNMLSAIGTNWENSYRSAVSFGRTIDGKLSEKQAAPLIKRTLHLISLVKPKQIIIFGDAASRAFFGEDLLTSRKKKQYINHVPSRIEAIVTIHPRILLERPALKAESWKDLQMLTRIAK